MKIDNILLRKFIRKIINENFSELESGSGIEFNQAKDSDEIGGGKAKLIFILSDEDSQKIKSDNATDLPEEIKNKLKKYDVNNHGLASHAIKHYHEFNKADYEKYFDSALSYIKSLPDKNLILCNQTDTSKIIAIGKKAKDQLNKNDVKKTIDNLHDKEKSGENLNNYELEFINKIAPIVTSYTDILKQTIDNSKDVKDLFEKENKNINNFINDNVSLKILGNSRDGGITTYYFNLEYMAIAITKNNNIIKTFMGFASKTENKLINLQKYLEDKNILNPESENDENLKSYRKFFFPKNENIQTENLRKIIRNLIKEEKIKSIKLR